MRALDRLVIPVAAAVAIAGSATMIREAHSGTKADAAQLLQEREADAEGHLPVLGGRTTGTGADHQNAGAESPDKASSPGKRSSRSSSSYQVDWHARYLAEHRHVQRLLHRLARHVQAHETDWRAKQIAAAETIGHEAGADPWPNCPDPVWDGAASWDVTVACENNGNWLDSPGFYRCGLQFDPMWERRFGRLCP